MFAVIKCQGLPINGYVHVIISDTQTFEAIKTSTLVCKLHVWQKSKIDIEPHELCSERKIIEVFLLVLFSIRRYSVIYLWFVHIILCDILNILRGKYDPQIPVVAYSNK